MAVNLTSDTDILASVASHPQRPLCVGFAAETQMGETEAKRKLHEKNLDLIALNDVSQSDIGFDVDTNALMVYTAQHTYSIPKNTKYEVALTLLQIISEYYYAKNQAKDS